MIRSAAVVALLAGSAHAEPCDDGSCKPLQPWSWAPILSAMTVAQEAHDLAGVFGGELRVRHNSETADPLIPLSLGVGLQTLSFHTLEPSATVGVDFTHRLCVDCDDEAPLWADLRLAIGGGYSWNHTADVGFGVARVSFGVILARKDGMFGGSPRYRLRSQLDIVFETHVTVEGDVRVSVGIELDPARLFQDMVAFSQ